MNGFVEAENNEVGGSDEESEEASKPNENADSIHSRIRQESIPVVGMELVWSLKQRMMLFLSTINMHINLVLALDEASHIHSLIAYWGIEFSFAQSKENVERTSEIYMSSLLWLRKYFTIMLGSKSIKISPLKGTKL